MTVFGEVVPVDTELCVHIWSRVVCTPGNIPGLVYNLEVEPKQLSKEKFQGTQLAFCCL